MAQPSRLQGKGLTDLIVEGAVDSLGLNRGRAWPGWLDRAGKRTLDLLVAGLALLLLSPVLVLIAVLIRLNSPGPALFRQVRVGYRSGPFVMLKFRTMYQDNDDAIHRAFVTSMLAGSPTPLEDTRPLYKLTGDPRVTAVGGFLRRLSLDELPQLINVVRGEMSLVGPRPALPWEVELFEPRHRARFTVKPGITGLWQVSGRNLLTMGQALDLDVEYARRRNLALDLATLARTVPVVLTRRGAS
jgi:lipopolysaccharide/colanic/teichoic acid biosynthesis glycosyltransferase